MDSPARGGLRGRHLITINATDTILLKGVAQVQASDFIVHA